MRSAGNFHPDWGYLAPAPSFMRTVRIALVATAIGAVAGAVVVVSLVERPGSNEDTAIAAHALLTRAPVIKTPAVASRPIAPAVPKTTPTHLQPSVASAAPSAPPAVTAPAGAAAAPLAPNATANARPSKADSINPPLPLPAPNDAAVAAVAPVGEAAPALAGTAAVAPDTAAEARAPAKRSAAKRRRYEPAYRRQETAGARSHWRDSGGFQPLFRLFSFRTGSSFSSN